jgi:hypothetical protein
MDLISFSSIEAAIQHEQANGRAVQVEITRKNTTAHGRAHPGEDGRIHTQVLRSSGGIWSSTKITTTAANETASRPEEENTAT